MNELENGKHEEEEVCAQTFLDWLSFQRNTSYKLSRAEEIFPELANGLVWEFVVRSEENGPWIALEVKSLVLADALARFVNWQKFFAQVSQELAQKGVSGYFSISGRLPSVLTPREKNRLHKAVVQAFLELTPAMSNGTGMNLGPRIAELFPKWPQKPPKLSKDLTRIIHTPECLRVIKSKSSDCAIDRVSASEPFYVDAKLYEACSQILQSEKANKQLGLAKAKGALETILLLDSHIRWKPNVVAQILRSVDNRLLYDIGAAYLIDTSNKRVAKVWP